MLFLIQRIYSRYVSISYIEQFAQNLSCENIKFLSIFRRHRDVACETLPIRTHDEVIKRYAKSPIVKSEPKIDTVNGNDANSRLTKLEMNLKRFEDERTIFALEKEKFEREKWHMEQIRFQRLLEFERKRSMQQREREQLAVQAAAIALAEIEKQRIAAMEYERLRRSKSKSREPSFNGSHETYDDDYVSSTATSASSRDDDFKDHDFDNEVPFQNTDESIVEESFQPVEYDNTETVQATEITEEPQANELSKQSLLFRFIFGKKKPKPVTTKRSYLNIRIDDGKPVSIQRIVFYETPLVWQQVLELHQQEWEQMMRIRNRCIAKFLLLCIFFGFGGLMFRFIEGAFENFYKCGVRRVKRDFVDNLWSSSHDLRLAFYLNTINSRHLRLFHFHQF